MSSRLNGTLVNKYIYLNSISSKEVQVRTLTMRFIKV